MDLRNAKAKARDEWFGSRKGRECCKGTTGRQYLLNRLEDAFLAGYDASQKAKEHGDG